MVRPTRQSSLVRVAGAGAVLIMAALVNALAPIPASASSSAQSKQLTCSFIARQCRRQCSSQAPKAFCKTYCASERRQCMKTGTWSGIARTFSNVRRQ